MIKTFDKPTCRFIGDEIDKALAEVAKRLGLTVRPSGGTYTETTFTAKIELRLAPSNPAAKSAEQSEFAKYCVLYHLEPKHYGTVLHTTKYGDVTLIGFNTRRSKFPIMVRSLDGKVRLFASPLIRHLQKMPELTEETRP